MDFDPLAGRPLRSASLGADVGRVRLVNASRAALLARVGAGTVGELL